MTVRPRLYRGHPRRGGHTRRRALADERLSGPPPGRLSALAVLHSKSVFCGGFLWARRALNRPKHGGFRGPSCRRLFGPRSTLTKGY
jgi:hypothetical protein